MPSEDPSWKVFRSFGGAHDEQSNTSSSDYKNDTRKEHFDFIFDYTFFCALLPSLRPAWGARTAELLAPGTGRLLTFMFPILTDADPRQGPPYPVTIDDYRRVLEPHGVHMDDDKPRQNAETVPSRAGRELVCWWIRNDDRNKPFHKN